MAANSAQRIIVGVHGVGSPAVGEVAQSICYGYARAHPNNELITRSSLLHLNQGGGGHDYHCIEVQRGSETLEIWEVNWSDLKGLPDGKIGSAFYALKAIVAMMQITHKGWETKSTGVTGPLWCGALLRAYFCAFSLVAPLNMLLIAFAFIQDSPIIAVGIVAAFLACAIAVLLYLQTIDRLICFSLPFLVIGVLAALWIINDKDNAGLQTLPYLIATIGAIENVVGSIALLAVVELAIRFCVAKWNERTGCTWTVFITRAGMAIIAITMGAAAYTALVNAIGFYVLDKIKHAKLVSDGAFHDFEKIYLANIGYHLAQMEFINWVITFGVGTFLIAGIGYQLVRICTSSDMSAEPRGLRIQNVLNVFLWLTLAGFVFVFISFFADKAHFFDSSNCDPNETCSIYGMQWLFPSRHTEPLSPLDIYAASATRIVPFLVPVFIPSLRVGLNVIADVLLYILPSGFPFSIQIRARNRLNALLAHLQTQHPGAKISLLAHSQGTVIARDVLSPNHKRVTRFVTAGSPLGSLYGRFLGRQVNNINDCEWQNVYRASDYIAGPLNHKKISDVPLKGSYRAGHIHYFDEAEVIHRTLNSRP